MREAAALVTGLEKATAVLAAGSDLATAALAAGYGEATAKPPVVLAKDPHLGPPTGGSW